MPSLCDIASFLLDRIDCKETKNLALVNSQIFNGPPTAYISRSVYNNVPKRKINSNSKLWDFVEKIKLKKPNLHTLKDSLKGLDINTLTLEWSYPTVRSTTIPPSMDLPTFSPYLKVLILKENGKADHSLLFFQSLILPKHLKLLDVSELHLPTNIDDFLPVINSAKGRNCKFCSCCHVITSKYWEKKWTQVDHIIRT